MRLSGISSGVRRLEWGGWVVVSTIYVPSAELMLPDTPYFLDSLPSASVLLLSLDDL